MKRRWELICNDCKKIIAVSKKKYAFGITMNEGMFAFTSNATKDFKKGELLECICGSTNVMSYSFTLDEQATTSLPSDFEYHRSSYNKDRQEFCINGKTLDINEVKELVDKYNNIETLNSIIDKNKSENADYVWSSE